MQTVEILALVIFMVVTIQYSGMEISAYQLQAVVPDASLGTYTFTGSSEGAGVNWRRS